MRSSVLAVVLAVPFLIAPLRASAAPDAGTSAGQEKVVRRREVSSKDMTHERRRRFMRAVVMPKMKPL